MKFINRDNELKSLEKKWQDDKSHFIIIYGKRRVGKTELIKQFIKGKPSVYFLADKRPETEQLRELSRIVSDFFKDSLVKERGLGDWLEFFRYLKEKNKGKFILAIDEYPYIVEVNRAVSSVFQKGWDEYLKDLGVFFILSGSSIAMMESEALIHQSPLYGRRTGQILVKPLTFKESHNFFPKKSFEEFMGIYTVTGGMPAYLLQWDPGLSLNDNIKSKVFLSTEFLHNEVEFILKEEFREPKNYLSILRAISWGKRKFSEIVNETGLEKNVLTKYLITLEKLNVIEKEVSVTEKNQQKSRKGLYLISDNFFRFWFQYVFPYKSDLEIGNFNEVLRRMTENFKILEAIVYEKACQEILWSIRDRIFAFEKVGRWWDKEKEIDIIALNAGSREILFGEAKWSEKQVGTNIFEDLKKKAKFVGWNQEKRKEYYILFSKSGFTKDMLDLAQKEAIFLVHKDQLITGV